MSSLQRINPQRNRAGAGDGGCEAERLDAARRAAAEYDGDAHAEESSPPDQVTGLAEERIRAALAAGELDNLPGAGKPLRLERNPYLDSATQTLYNLLADHHCAPDWIERGKRLRADLDAARGRLRRALRRDPTRGPVWQAAVAEFADTLGGINRQIDDHNAVTPIRSQRRARLDPARELAAIEVEG